MSVQETSQTSMRPARHGAIVTPSGRLLLDLLRAVGSNVEGIWADDRDGFTMSLITAWRERRPALLIQVSPWVAYSSTGAPQSRQAWEWHKGVPKRRPAAVLTSSSSIQSLSLETGSAFNHEPDSLVAAARSLA